MQNIFVLKLGIEEQYPINWRYVIGDVGSIFILKL